MTADRSRRLGSLSWPRVPWPRPLVAVPLGSTEQHGPHLPVDTDTRIARAVADGLAARSAGVVVAPALPYGAAGEHAGFPGTLSTGAAVLELVVVELVRSADDTARGVVLVNGHGGNVRALRAATATLTSEGRRVLLWQPTARLNAAAGVPDPTADLHAGRSETSVLLCLRPDLVDLDAAVAGPTPPLAELFRHGVKAASSSGVLGDPAGASADEGARLLAAYVDDLVAAVAAWDVPVVRHDQQRTDRRTDQANNAQDQHDRTPNHRTPNHRTQNDRTPNHQAPTDQAPTRRELT